MKINTEHKLIYRMMYSRLMIPDCLLVKEASTVTSIYNQ